MTRRVADEPRRTTLLQLASRMAPSLPLQAVGAGGVGEVLSVAGSFKAVSVVQTVWGKLDASVVEVITHKAR